MMRAHTIVAAGWMRSITDVSRAASRGSADAMSSHPTT